MKRSIIHLLHAAGVIAAVGGAWLTYREVIGPARYGNGNTSSLVWWAGLSALLITSGYALGLPDMPRRRRGALARVLGSLAVSFSVLSLAQLVTAQALLPRSSMLIIALVVPLWTLMTWNVAADLRTWSEGRDRVMLVTDRPDDVAALRADLDGREEVPASIVDVVAPAELRPSPDRPSPLVDRVADVDPTVIVLDRAAQNDDLVVAQIAQVHRTGIRVRTLALFYEGWLGKLPLAELAQVSLLFDIGEVHRTQYVRGKRVVDIAIGAVGTLACLALVPVVLVGNLTGNRGPLLFRQERVGKGGRPFTMLKFRTMTSGGDASSWTSTGDARVTRFGGLLRRTHLDELPQMVNILRGELSIVGPRPEQLHYVEELRAKIPFYDDRHMVRPGLTGWAQVKQGYAASDADALEKLQYDFYYLRRQSIAFDLRIVGRTLREVAGALGR